FFEHRAQPRTCGPLGQQIERFQDRQTSLDKCVELLVDNQKIAALNLAVTTSRHGTGEDAAARLDGIDVQSAVGKLLSGFDYRLCGFELRKYPARRISYFEIGRAHV